jgi:hypothetical protein
MRPRSLFNDLDLAVDAQNFRHLGFELGVAAFQVVAHLELDPGFRTIG